MIPSGPSFETADELALALLSGKDDVAWVLLQLQALLLAVEPWAAPSADIGILLSALAAMRPETIPVDIAERLASVIHWADLSRTAQPAVDEAFQLLRLLVASPAYLALPDLIDHVVCAPDLHPRWLSKAIELLKALDDWGADTLDVALLIATAERAPSHVANALFFTVVGSLLLAEPAACDLGLLQRACALSIEPSSARYVLNSLAEHAATPPDVRAWARSALSGWFPLRPVWRRLFGGRGLRLLCVQNIADGQGDEMVRLVPLLQALFDDHPETRITLVTDRAYLYDHPRLELISFDEPGQIARALNERFDGLLEFFEPHTPHLNHDTELAAAIADYRERYAPLFDLRAATGWNRFAFDSVRINGFEWADALQLNKCKGKNVYDPALRLIAELGLPLRIRTQAHPEPVLAHEPVLDRTWEHISVDRSTCRPTALLNPFSDRDALKGSAPEELDDLLRLIRTLIEEHYDVVICPTGLPRGSRALVDVLRARLPEDLRQYTSIAPDPATSPSPSAAMRDTVSLVAQVDLVVTVEGWMMHAARLNGKPCRLLLGPASGARDWQVWGRARDQGTWRFRGKPTLDVSPYPERSRRAAWLSLLNRINDPLWYDALHAIAGSPDHDVRRAALRALGRLERSDLQPYFVALLDDPSWAIRALAAEVLLERYPAAADGRPDRRTLEGYRAIGLVPYEGWEQVAHLESSALPAVRATLHDADPVMRREAAMILERYSRMLESPNGSGSIGATGMDGAPHEL